MADAQTTNLGLVKPELNTPSWGTKVNQNLDLIDEAFSGGGGGALVRHTVLRGPLDADGRASFIQAGAGLQAVLQAASVPLVLSLADGYNSQGPVDYPFTLTQDTPVTLAPNARNRIYAERDSEGNLIFGAITDSVDCGVTPPLLTTSVTGTDATQRGVNGDAGWPQTLTYTVPLSIDQQAVSAQLTIAVYWVDAQSSDNVLNSTVRVNASINGNPNIDVTSAWTGSAEGSAAVKTFTVPLNYLNLNGSNTIVYTFTYSSGYKEHMTIYYSTLTVNVMKGPGTHWFDTQNYKMFRWDGTSWNPLQRLFLGEAVTNATSVVSTRSYAYNGRTVVSQDTIASKVTYIKDHNLGCIPNRVKLLGATAVNGYLCESNYWPSAGITYGNLTDISVSIFTHTYQHVLTGPEASANAAQVKLFLSRGW